MSAILTVCRKEILDTSRDRRTLLTATLFGPLMGPILFVIIFNVSISRATSSAEGEIPVPMIGAEHAENLVAFLASRGIVASEGHGLADIDEGIRAVRDGERQVIVAVDAAFGDDLANEAGAHVSLIYDESDTASNQRVARVREAIRAYSQQIGSLRLLARGIDPSLARPLIIDNFDVSTAEERSSLILGMLTYFLLFATLMGGLHVATDTTAGERERKSLEPLLATPVSRSSLILGKMCATAAYMLLSLGLTLTFFTVAIPFLSIDDLGMSTSFGPWTALNAFLVLAPVAPLGAALMTAVVSFTKSYREAQSYLGFVILVPTLPLILALMLDVQPSMALMAVPSLSQHLLITNLIRAEPIEAPMLAISMATTLLLGALLAFVAVRLYQRERILG